MKRVILLNLCMFLGMCLFAQKAEIYSSADGAVRGYDVIEYFKQGKPVKGEKEFTYSWKGAQWFFSKKENLELFKTNPEKYAPQYGGYCAYGLSEGHKAPTDPNAFTVTNDKLYLNYSIKTKEVWNKNQEKRINTADTLWTKLKDKE